MGAWINKSGLNLIDWTLFIDLRSWIISRQPGVLRQPIDPPDASLSPSARNHLRSIVQMMVQHEKSIMHGCLITYITQ